QKMWDASTRIDFNQFIPSLYPFSIDITDSNGYGDVSAVVSATTRSMRSSESPLLLIQDEQDDIKTHKELISSSPPILPVDKRAVSILRQMKEEEIEKRKQSAKECGLIARASNLINLERHMRQRLQKVREEAELKKKQYEQEQIDRNQFRRQLFDIKNRLENEYKNGYDNGSESYGSIESLSAGSEEAVIVNGSEAE
ncbi:MAG: hypothetical protein EZS28_055584, partial [Streblomastix strix]